jgi:cytochrome c-type biogenesis protein CcmH
MTFWIIAAATTVVLLIAFIRALMTPSPDDQDPVDMAVYKDQLSEVDRDLARNVISKEEADRLRVEISRRILALDKAEHIKTRNLSFGQKYVTAVTLCAVLGGGGYVLYSNMGQPGYTDIPLKLRIENANASLDTRPSQDEFWEKMPAQVPLNSPTGDYAQLVEKLRATVAERPNDLQGYVLLSQIEAGLENYRAAAQAQGKVLSLKGDAATAQDYFEYGELLILSSNGYVSPEAERALRAVLARDDQNEPARYYLGVLMAQNDRPDVAFRLWRQLLAVGNADDPWIAPIRAMMPEIAFRAGQTDYELPPLPDTGILPGPSDQDIAAAQDMSGEDRQDMIRGMVARLSDRLATDGGTPQEWARLINALGVLGDLDQARAIYANAQQVFADTPDAMAPITAAAQQVGIAE